MSAQDMRPSAGKWHPTLYANRKLPYIRRGRRPRRYWGLTQSSLSPKVWTNPAFCVHFCPAPLYFTCFFCPAKDVWSAPPPPAAPAPLPAPLFLGPLPPSPPLLHSLCSFTFCHSAGLRQAEAGGVESADLEPFFPKPQTLSSLLIAGSFWFF